MWPELPVSGALETLVGEETKYFPQAPGSQSGPSRRVWVFRFGLGYVWFWGGSFWVGFRSFCMFSWVLTPPNNHLT